MARVLVSDPAKRDLRNILSDLAERAGYRISARYADAFKTTYRRLSDFPESGSPRPALGPTTRIAIVRPYLVIYETTDEGGAVVLRVLHGKRNIRRDLLR